MSYQSRGLGWSETKACSQEEARMTNTIHSLYICISPYLEGRGDLVSRLIMGIIRVTIWVIGVINLLTKSP